MLAIPLDSDPIFCRDTIICAVAAADEDDGNKLESTADITNRDRSEDAEGIEPREGMGRREGEMMEAGERNYRCSRHPKRLRRRERYSEQKVTRVEE